MGYELDRLMQMYGVRSPAISYTGAAPGTEGYGADQELYKKYKQDFLNQINSVNPYYAMPQFAALRPMGAPAPGMPGAAPAPGYAPTAPTPQAPSPLTALQEPTYSNAAPATPAPAVPAATAPLAALRPAAGGAASSYIEGPTSGPADDAAAAWGNMSPLEQAQYYSMHPTMAAITQLGQNIFGYTIPGMIQNALVPEDVQLAKDVANGNLLANYMAQYDHFGNLLTPTGLPANVTPNAANLSLTNGLVANLIGQQAAAPVEDAVPTISNAQAAQQAAAEYNASLGSGASNIGYDSGGFGSYGENAAPGGAPAPGAIDGGYGSYGENVAPSGDGGGGDGGSKMICTELHRQGLMPEEIFAADQAFGEILVRLHPETYAGYARWARHVVRWMRREDLFGRAVTKLAHIVATPWSREMARSMGVAAAPSLVGRAMMAVGLPLCKWLGSKTAEPRLKQA
jgi:hypothetical protein